MTTDDGLQAVLERSRSLGFLGPGSLRVQADHAAGFAVVVESAPHRLLDLGSGGGVPGLVLASVWPACAVTLLDAGARRCEFLQEAVEDLGWNDRVQVVRARAEEAGRRDDLRGTFDLVVARSFGAPAATAECGSPFLRVGGRLAVSEPPAMEDGSRWPHGAVSDLGLAEAGEWFEPYHYQAFVQERPCPDRYPRRVGVPAKRPLF